MDDFENEDTIELSLDKLNELMFRVHVEGTVTLPRVRLVCDSHDGISFMFGGKYVNGDIVQFDIPVMKGRMTEGTYDARLEVLVDDRHFSPSKFKVRFKCPVSVVAETLSVRETPTKRQDVSVFARPMTLREHMIHRKTSKTS